MTKEEVELHARICGLEVFAVNQLAISCLTSGPDPKKTAEMMKSQLIDGARKLTFPDYDPANSDLISSEVEAALRAIVSRAFAQIDHCLKYQTMTRGA